MPIKFHWYLEQGQPQLMCLCLGSVEFCTGAQASTDGANKEQEMYLAKNIEYSKTAFMIFGSWWVITTLSFQTILGTKLELFYWAIFFGPAKNGEKKIEGSILSINTWPIAKRSRNIAPMDNSSDSASFLQGKVAIPWKQGGKIQRLKIMCGWLLVVQNKLLITFVKFRNIHTGTINFIKMEVCFN